MMPIEEWEISAYLDGELPAERREEVRRAIAEDEHLRRQYEQFVALDAELQTLAKAAAFDPCISLPGRAMANRLDVFQWTCALLLLRLVLKLVPFAWNVGLAVVLLAALLVWALPYLLRLAEEDRRQIFSVPAAG